MFFVVRNFMVPFTKEFLKTLKGVVSKMYIQALTEVMLTFFVWLRSPMKYAKN